MGDPACWIGRTCPDCGAVVAEPGSRDCPRCGRSEPRPDTADEATLRRNWGGNHTYAATSLAEPVDLARLQDVVTTTTRLKVLGSRHSFNAVADTEGTHLTLRRMDPFVQVDAAAATARVSAWSTYAEVAPALHDQGFALPNLASLPHISIAGACATATHGSGNNHRNLATHVNSLELVTGTGEHRTLSRADDPEAFPGAVVGLGALGVVVAVTLDLQPAVEVHQRAWVDLPRDQLLANLDEVMAGASSVSCFLRWQDDLVDLVLHKDARAPEDDPVEVFGAPQADAPMHPIVGLDPVHVTEQLGRPGPWHERLPHFRPGFTPSAGEEIQSEFFVDRADGVAAIEAVWAIGDQLRDVLQVSELRTVAADDLWLSPMHRRDVLGLHFTWTLDPPGVDRAVAMVEQALAPFGAVPHWGKVSHAGPDLWNDHYDRLDDFRALAADHDPEGRFRNAFLDDLLG